MVRDAAPFSKATFSILLSFSGLSSGHTEEFVCLCYCQGWQLAFSTLCHREAVTAGVWPTPRLSALLLHPCSLACPATLLVARSPLSIYTAYGSGQLETCSVQLGAAASWASPSFLHTSSPFLSDGRGLSLAHAHNHANADGRTIPGSGSEATPHIQYTTHPCCCICTHTEPDGRTGGCLPCQTPCLISLMFGLASGMRKIRLRPATIATKACKINSHSQSLEFTAELVWPLFRRTEDFLLYITEIYYTVGKWYDAVWERSVGQK